MSLQNHTTDGDKEIQVKIEAYSAIQMVKDILSGLAAIALLRMQAAGGSDFSSSFWRDLYKDSPWGRDPGDPGGILPSGLEEEMNHMIFKQAGAAWLELEKVEKVFGPDFVKEVWVKRHGPEEGQEGEE